MHTGDHTEDENAYEDTEWDDCRKVCRKERVQLEKPSGLFVDVHGRTGGSGRGRRCERGFNVESQYV